MLPSAALLPLVSFMALLFAASLHALAAAGHFPRAHDTALRSAAGALILYGSIVLSIACVGAGFVIAWQRIPWSAAVIGGGLMLLFAPLALQLFPDWFVDGAGALIAFAGASAVFALLLIVVQ